MAKFTTGSQWAESFGETAVSLGKPSFQKSAVFFNIVQKAFDPPLYLNICPILQGVFLSIKNGSNKNVV